MNGKTFNNRLALTIYNVGIGYAALSAVGIIFLTQILGGVSITVKIFAAIVATGQTLIVTLAFFGVAEIIELLYDQNLNSKEIISIQNKFINNLVVPSDESNVFLENTAILQQDENSYNKEKNDDIKNENVTDSQEKEKIIEEKSKGKVEYWMKHREEQKQLESEMQEHNLLLEKLSDGRNNLPEKERERELYHKLNELIDQKKLLGVHKKSEKKAICLC